MAEPTRPKENRRFSTKPILKLPKMKLAAVIQPTYQGLTKRFSAYCPDIPGCIAHAPTADKALEDLKARVIYQIKSREELGLASIKNHSQVQVLEI
jgi:hypothetical protein